MRQDFTFALRQLVRQPGLTAAAIGTLALGLGASLAVFTILNAVLLRPLPYPDADRVMTIGRAGAGGLGNGSHRDVQFLREHVRACAPIAAAVSGGGMNMTVHGHASHVQDRLIARGYFEALSVQPRWGRTFSADEDVQPPPPVVMLNERLLRNQQLDAASLVGAQIILSGVTHTVVGIVSARQTLASDPDVYRPLGNDARGAGQNLQIVCRLADGATPATLDAELSGLTEEARRNRLASDQAPRAYAAVSLHEWEFGSVRPALVTLMVAVGLVLLVAAANTTGLLLVRAAGRRREIAVRIALGASPRRIARSLLTEGFMLAALSGAIGLATAPVLVRGLLAVAPAYYTELAEFTYDRIVLATALGLCALVGLSMSVPPLLELLRVNLRDTLQEEGPRGTSGRQAIWLRHLLVGAETATCAVLLVGALLLLRTVVNLVNVPTGFDPSGLVTARMTVQGPEYAAGDRLVRFFEDGIARLEQMPSIQAASVAASLPAERALNLPARFPDSDDPSRITAVNWRYVTPNYFDLLRIRRVAGRTFTVSDRMGATPVALVNEAFAKQMFGGLDKAIGRRIVMHQMTKDINDPVREVVGIVGDTAGWSLGAPPRPMMFVPLAQLDSGMLQRAHAFFPPRWIVRTTEDVAGARHALETVVRELDPDQPFIEVQTVESMMLRSIGMQRFYLVVLLAFAVFGMALAAVGIYATYSYAVASRTQEIGVRLALGAAPSRILGTFLGHSVLLGGIATGVGLAAAAAATRALRAVLFGVTTTDPVTFGAVGVILLLTVVAATLVPAVRAARVDPLVAIRR